MDSRRFPNAISIVVQKKKKTGSWSVKKGWPNANYSIKFALHSMNQINYCAFEFERRTNTETLSPSSSSSFLIILAAFGNDSRDCALINTCKKNKKCKQTKKEATAMNQRNDAVSKSKYKHDGCQNVWCRGHPIFLFMLLHFIPKT